MDFLSSSIAELNLLLDTPGGRTGRSWDASLRGTPSKFTVALSSIFFLIICSRVFNRAGALSSHRPAPASAIFSDRYSRNEKSAVQQQPSSCIESRRKVKRRRTTILKELSEAAAGGVAGRVPLPCLRGSCGGGESYICPRTRRRRSAQWGSRMVAHRGTAGEADLKMAFWSGDGRRIAVPWGIRRQQISSYMHQRHAMQRQRTGTLETLKSEFLTNLRRQEPLLLIV